MYFITDKIRNDICDSFNNNTYIPFLDLSVVSFPKDKVIFEMMLVDYYNVLLIKKKEVGLERGEIQILHLINSNPVDRLINLMDDSEFIVSALSGLMAFNKLSKLDRHDIIKRIESLKEDNDLTKRPLYKINTMSNMPSYEIKDLLCYYKNYIEVNGKTSENHWMSVETIIQYIEDMKENYKDKYEKCIIDALITYYKNEKYLSLANAFATYYEDQKYLRHMKDKQKIWERFIFLKGIEWLSKKQLLKAIDNNSNFMMEIISKYFYYESFSDSIKELVNKDADKSLSKKMQKKLAKLKEED